MNPLLILLLLISALVAILLWFFWKLILLIAIGGSLLCALYRYFWQQYGCVRCGGAGILAGDDPVLHVHFHAGEPCYLCGGNRIPPQDRQRWNHIAKKALHRLRSLRVQEELLLRKIEQFRKAMKFSASTAETIVFAHNNILAQHYRQLATLESEITAYALVYRQAFVNAHNINLLQRMDQERADLETWEDQRLDQLNNSLFVVKDATFLHQADFLPLLQQPNQDYLQLVSEPIRKDIETAIAELKLLIKTEGKI
jgi:hypothetical protein